MIIESSKGNAQALQVDDGKKEQEKLLSPRNYLTQGEKIEENL